MNVLEPLFDRTFIYDSYACRAGKGTHRAVDRCQQSMRNSRYVLQYDIRSYFPSIDHTILFSMLKKKIADPDVLWLLNLIIESTNHNQEGANRQLELFNPPKGIPIGDLTSQFFANLYLNELDSWVKHQLKVRGYLRYMDDFLLFGDDKKELHRVRARIDAFLWQKLRLKLHPEKVAVFPVSQGISFLGYRVFLGHRRLMRANITRFKRRMKKLKGEYESGEGSLKAISCSLNSWLGYALHANTYRLRKNLLRDLVFSRSTQKG